MPRLPALTASLVLLSLLSRHSWAAPSTASCDGLTSCSPSECVRSQEGDCTLNTPTVDIPGAVAGLPCKSCTQATSDVCNNPGSVFLTEGDHIKAVWCNADFMVVVADGLPQYSAADSLAGIPLPPGGGSSCRVRSAAAQLNVYKVPLTTQKLTSGSNSVPSPLPNVPGMPDAGATAVALDGVPIFPNYNNRGMPTWVSCEIDYCNAHSGKGEDYHYHGDPFGSRCLYSQANYTSSSAHPPLIGFSLDGYKINGRYTATTQQGQDVALDSCGGHDHSSLGYHYHPQVSQGTTTELDGVQNPGTVTYTKFDGAPAQCFAADVSQISNFWESATRGQVNYDSTKTGLCDRNDVEDLKPCCGMTNFYAAAGVSPNTVAGSGTCSATGDGSSGGGSSGSCSGSTGETGTCSGTTDNSGKACPPDFGPLPNRPCPPGCTAVCASVDTTTQALQDTTTEAGVASTTAASTTAEGTTVAGTTMATTAATTTMAEAATTTTMATTATTETVATTTEAVAAPSTTAVAELTDTTDTTGTTDTPDSTTPMTATTETAEPQSAPTVASPSASFAAAVAMPAVWVWGVAAAVTALS